MPNYSSLGISASLLATELNPTLTDEINFRMGARQQKDDDRIKSLLANGRLLLERPMGLNHAQVGVLQFIGEDGDMAFYMVEVKDRQTRQTEQAVQAAAAGQTNQIADEVSFKSNVGATPTRAAASSDDRLNTDMAPSSRNAAVPTSSSPMKTRVKATIKSYNKPINSKQPKKAKRKPSTPITPPTNTRKSAQTSTPDSDDSIALSLKVDCTKFLQAADPGIMGGKDLKLEVFINGRHEGTVFKATRTGTRETFVFSGTRIHRQAEKPWVYVPSTNISDTGATQESRWTSISQDLQQEASTRGMNPWAQRPLSAQFLLSLAQLQSPGILNEEEQSFAVIDLIITAGKGGKHGPGTAYITKPERLNDKKFTGPAPIIGPDPVTANTTLYHEYEQTPGMEDNRDVFGMHGADTTTMDTFMDDEAFASTQWPDMSPSPHTLRKESKHSFSNYQKVLKSPAMKQLIPNYSNAHGRARGERSLKQRLGDMAKMSPSKRDEVVKDLEKSGELDKETIETIKSAFDMGAPAGESPAHKKVRFSKEPATTSDVTKEQPMFQDTSGTIYPRNVNSLQGDPFHLPEDSFFGPNSQFRPDGPLDPALRLSPDVDGTSPEPPARPTRRRSSTLNKSPTSKPAKRPRRPSQRKKTVKDEEEADVSVNEQPLLSLSTAIAFKPQRSELATSKNKDSLEPGDTPSGRALQSFQAPDFWAGGTVAYADGLKQRQIGKARGGEFEEQYFVVGMRWIVL